MVIPDTYIINVRDTCVIIKRIDRPSIFNLARLPGTLLSDAQHKPFSHLTLWYYAWTTLHQADQIFRLKVYTMDSKSKGWTYRYTHLRLHEEIVIEQNWITRTPRLLRILIARTIGHKRGFIGGFSHSVPVHGEWFSNAVVCHYRDATWQASASPFRIWQVSSSRSRWSECTQDMVIVNWFHMPVPISRAMLLLAMRCALPSSLPK